MAKSEKLKRGKEIREKSSICLARAFLDAEMRSSEKKLLASFGEIVDQDVARLFTSTTQAYREALVGCALIRSVDTSVDIHLPRADQSENSFSNRTALEKIVTPFLKSKAIPVSKAPYLSALRGDVKFIKGGQPRVLDDQKAFDCLADVVAFLSTHDQDTAYNLLVSVLGRFIELRESSTIPLLGVNRLSLEQYRNLTRLLLAVPSNGRIPMMLSIALLRTVRDCFDLKWEIEHQGINVADKASGAVGDITVKLEGKVLLAVEVTERKIDNDRVASVFEEKIGPASLPDYLFVFTNIEPTTAAKAAARSYFSIGHEVNFVSVSQWIDHVLATVGTNCRNIFKSHMSVLLADLETPKALRVAWNECLKQVVATPPSYTKGGEL